MHTCKQTQNATRLSPIMFVTFNKEHKMGKRTTGAQREAKKDTRWVSVQFSQLFQELIKEKGIMSA